MLGAGGALMGLAAVASGGFAVALAPFVNSLMVPLLAGGVSTEAGAIAQALTQQRGMNITTRQPASYRQIIYGTQRVGGVIVYQSTTGSKHDQYNFVIVLATHEVEAIENLYLDGRRVYWNSGTGNTTRNGYNFGGSAATSGGIDGSGTYIGPNGQHYNFGTLVYCEARFGDQADGDVISGLTANDPNWATGAAGAPWLGGCCYVYLKIEYDTSMFPALPEIRFTVHGKNNIMDPRTGVAGYSTNPALIVGNIFADPTWGLGDATVNESQLIAAANVCDQMVACAPTEADPAGSLDEAQYAACWHYDTSTPPGEAIKVFLAAMGGRLTRSGGEWYIWPAYWQGPTASWDENVLLAAPKWSAYRKPDELINRVNGTYIAPNYPYNVAGDLYDANGWYEGGIQNNFPFAFQPTNYPQYAADPLHGYPSDQYLAEDSGAGTEWSSTVSYAAGAVVLYGSPGAIFRAIAANTNAAPVATAVVWNALVSYTTGESVNYNGSIYTARTSTTGNEPDTSPTQWQLSPWIPYGNQLPRELELKAVLSVSQAQRLAKITLMRNRQQGSGVLEMKMSAFGMQGIDTFQMNFSQLGWSEYLLEISGEPQLSLEGGDAEEGEEGEAPYLKLSVPVQDTSTTVYEWSVTEELTVYDVPAMPTGIPYTVAPPTSVTLESGANTAVTGADGVVTPRVLVLWTDPLDAYVTQILIQFRPTGSSNPWQSAPPVPVGLGQAYVSGVVAGQAYDFQVAAQRGSGATSTWVEALDYTVSLTLSITVYSGVSLAPVGTLVAWAMSDGTAQIQVANWSWTVAGQVLNFTFSPGTLTGLAQNTLYYVYFVDASLTGGTFTPVATQNPADFVNKAGYLLIGTIVTPSYAPLYRPSSSSDVGAMGTTNPSAAYDGNVNTFATVYGQWFTSGTEGGLTYPSQAGDCYWQGFANTVLAANATLSVVVTPTIRAGTAPGTQIAMAVNVWIGGTKTVLQSWTGAASETTLTMTIPAGTNLSTVSVELTAAATAPSGFSGSGAGGCALEDAEIWIQ